jgi:hypothetical protein
MGPIEKHIEELDQSHKWRPTHHLTFANEYLNIPYLTGLKGEFHVNINPNHHLLLN